MLAQLVSLRHASKCAAASPQCSGGLLEALPTGLGTGCTDVNSHIEHQRLCSAWLTQDISHGPPQDAPKQHAQEDAAAQRRLAPRRHLETRVCLCCWKHQAHAEDLDCICCVCEAADNEGTPLERPHPDLQDFRCQHRRSAHQAGIGEATAWCCCPADIDCWKKQASEDLVCQAVRLALRNSTSCQHTITVSCSLGCLAGLQLP